jgi:hypothetical protein
VKAGIVSSGASNLYNCPITTVSGGEVADSRSQSEARNATLGLSRSTSRSGEAAGEGANHCTDKRFCRYKLAQGTTIVAILSADQSSANRQVSHHQIGSQRPPAGSVCLGRRPVDWSWRSPMVNASVSCQRVRRRIRPQKGQIVPRCTTIWHRMCAIWTLKLEVAVVANGGPRLDVSCCSTLCWDGDSSTPVRLKNGPWSLGTLRTQPAGAPRLASLLPLRAKNFESL